jgi:hypothetical protein
MKSAVHPARSRDHRTRFARYRFSNLYLSVTQGLQPCSPKRGRLTVKVSELATIPWRWAGRRDPHAHPPDGTEEKAKEKASSSAGVVQGSSSGAVSTGATEAQLPASGSGSARQARGGADQEATTAARGAHAHAKGDGSRAESTGADAGDAAAATGTTGAAAAAAAAAAAPLHGAAEPLHGAAEPLHGAAEDDSGEGEPDDSCESAGGRDTVYGAALHFDIAPSPPAPNADADAQHDSAAGGTAPADALLRLRPAAQRPDAAADARTACELPPGLQELAQAATDRATAAAKGPGAAASPRAAGASSAAGAAAAHGDAAPLPKGDGRSAFTAVTVFLPNSKAPGAAAAGTPALHAPSTAAAAAAPAASARASAGDKAPGVSGGSAPSPSPAAAAAAAAVAAIAAGERWDGRVVCVVLCLLSLAWPRGVVAAAILLLLTPAPPPSSLACAAVGGGTGAPRGAPGAGMLPDAVVQLIAVLATGRGGGAPGNACAAAAALSSRLAALQSNAQGGRARVRD